MERRGSAEGMHQRPRPELQVQRLTIIRENSFERGRKSAKKAKRPLRGRKSTFIICTLQLNWAAARPVKVRFRRFY